MIPSRSVPAFYLFDIAQGIDLSRVQAIAGAQAMLATVP